MGHDVAALSKQFVEFRLAKKNDEAANMVADNVKWTSPTMTGSEVYNGKDKVKEFWAKQDKDLPTIVESTDFIAKDETTATRSITVKKMMMKFKLNQVYKFDADGKICEYETVKA
ncbi:hypothetical protein DIPPA_10948 [Diplonema papillatum]|nr:hypothetical protein DIPPA_10948 [Diplonema papillatum]|eukprot:gene20222-31094_t